MTKLNKSQTVYLALIERGFTHKQAVDAAISGPLARATYRVTRNFIAWAREQQAGR